LTPGPATAAGTPPGTSGRRTRPSCSRRRRGSATARSRPPPCWTSPPSPSWRAGAGAAAPSRLAPPACGGRGCDLRVHCAGVVERWRCTRSGQRAVEVVDEVEEGGVGIVCARPPLRDSHTHTHTVGEPKPLNGSVCCVCLPAGQTENRVSQEERRAALG
jgi:hypothetical protein